MDGTSSGGCSSGHRLDLPPGFRFHPTDEELVVHYLKNKVSSRPLPVAIINEIDMYKFDPWDLPARAAFGEHEWYFFTPRDRKYPNGARPNRAAASGYWKATGTDKPIIPAGGTQKLGVKKALVFYKGRPPKGIKTNWIMHEYRLVPDHPPKPMSFTSRRSLRLDDWVLCRIYKKSSHAPRLNMGSDSSCVEEVLASLPDMEDADANALPRLGSFGRLIMQQGASDPNFFENFAAESANQMATANGNLTPNVDSLAAAGHHLRSSWASLAQLDSPLVSNCNAFSIKDIHQASTCDPSSLKELWRDHDGQRRNNLQLGLQNRFFMSQHHQKAQNNDVNGGEVTESSSSFRWPFADPNLRK